MLSYRVENMTCGHCVGTITKALHHVDSEANVHIDPADHRVDIASEHASPEQFADAIKKAGYAPLENRERAHPRRGSRVAATPWLLLRLK